MKRELLQALKKHSGATLQELARQFSVSREAVRKQLFALEAEGYVKVQMLRRKTSGRPTAAYTLTPAGDELFPRQYDELAIQLVEAIGTSLQPKQARKVFDVLVENKVRFWQPQLKDLSFAKKIQALKKLYLDDDAYMEVVEKNGKLYLVESNCPYLNVAMRQPGLCNVTVNVLAKLLDSDVERIEKFQDGHGRCTFAIKRPRNQR